MFPRTIRFINNRYSAIKGVFSWARKNLTDTNYRTECSNTYDMLLRLAGSKLRFNLIGNMPS